VFFPHWSRFIPEEIYGNFECVVFHMTDLPFGRGGSPLQNLILRGLRRTKISAIRVERELDAGPVYLKEPVSLHGSAQEIYERVSKIIFSGMIPAMLKKKPVPRPQRGRPTVFARRKPEQSRLPAFRSAREAYDFIRMLDAEGYPPAFADFGGLRAEFTGAVLEKGGVRAGVFFRPGEKK
jgi:methionyl-tRNA formyltransferase